MKLQKIPRLKNLFFCLFYVFSQGFSGNKRKMKLDLYFILPKNQIRSIDKKKKQREKEGFDLTLDDASQEEEGFKEEK